MNASSEEKAETMFNTSTGSGAPVPAGVLRMLLPLLTFKAAFFVVALVMVQFFSIWDDAEFRKVRRWPPGGESTLSSRFATWDAAHYLHIAENGYRKGDLACAFYPLWPAVIKLGSYITGDVFSSGLALANLFSIAAVLLFWRLVCELSGSGMATTASTLLLVFPGSLFLSFIYTEALFLFLLASFFLLLLRNNWQGAAIVGFFLPLTKAVGIFCLAPFVWHWYSQRRPGREILGVCGPVAGYALYFLVMYHFTGNPMEGFEAQRNYPTQPSVSKVLDIPLNFRALFFIGDFPASAVDILNRLFFIVFLVSLPGIWHVNKTLFVYALLAGIIPALSASFYSFVRNVATCLPMFIGLAFYLQKNPHPVIRWSLVTAFLGVQLFLLFYYVNAFFAG